MFNYIFLISFIALFITEFVLNLLAHALALRLAMCHTLVFLFFNIAQFLNFLKAKKRKSHVIFLKAKVDVDTFATFLYAVAYVLVFGFVVVNSLHSLQLLVHRHDMDVHYGLVVLLVGGLDFLIKAFCWPFLDCGFDQKSIFGKLQKAVFYLTASILLLIIASLRCSTDHSIILWLDPSFTIVACIAICLAAFQPAKEFWFTLLLATPRNLDVSELLQLLRTKFPEVDIHEMRLWRESKTRVIATVHARMPDEKRYCILVQDIHKFLHDLGISRIVLQPEFEDSMDGGIDKSCILPCPC